MESTKLAEQKSHEFSALLLLHPDTHSQFPRDLISSYFHHTEIIQSGEKALKLHTAGRYNVIYLDLNLNDMHGLEFIKNIKNYDPEQLFIVFVSQEDANDIFGLIKLGISSFIYKPLSVDNVIRVTRTMLANLLQDSIHQDPHLNQQLLIQQQKLAQSGEMISMIAHQWRQPLSAITTIIGTLRTKLSLDYYQNTPDPFARLEEDLEAAFNRIEESAVYLSKTINDFRNFYRPKQSESKFNVAAAIDQVCRMVMIENDIEKIQFCFDFDRTIMIDSYQNELMQVLINLLNNSRDALKEHQILYPRISISLKQKNEMITIDVLDNGLGIKDETINKIFDPYFSTKSKKNGTGIGLYMCQTIVQSHLKGSIAVSNDVNFGGAHFHIQLPKNLCGVIV